MNDAPLHVLITDPHLRGGGQVRYVANLAASLTAMGHRVTIGCRRGSVLAEHAKAAGCIALDAFSFRPGLHPAAIWDDLRTLRRHVALERPDIVHVNGSQDHWRAAATLLLPGPRPCLVRTRHNTYPVAKHAANRLLNRRWTDYQIVVCDVVRRELAAHPAFDAARLCTIHNGVDAEAFAPNAALRAEARAEFGYAPEDLVCGIAARLVPAKGHTFLFQAAGILIREFPRLRLLVLGQGVLEERLRQEARALGIAEITRFAGFREDMARCTQAFDIGVLPSIDCDTSSFSLKEEMAAEKPVVASDYGGLTEIVREGCEGFVVPQGTVAPLAAALRRLLADADLRRRMGAAGRKRVLEEFTIEVFARRTVAAYREAMRFAQRHQT